MICLLIHRACSCRHYPALLLPANALTCLLLPAIACRLWVTAEPHPQFPIGLLQMGIKITNEAPVGMKAGLRASYQWVNQDMLDAVSRWGTRAVSCRHGNCKTGLVSHGLLRCA
jgi:hypothetical protein